MALNSEKGTHHAYHTQHHSSDQAVGRSVCRLARQRRTERVLLKGALSNDDAVLIVDKLDALTNARIIEAELVVSFAFSGMKAAATSNVPNENIQEFMALNFSGVNPINARKRVSRPSASQRPSRRSKALAATGAPSATMRT